MPLKPQNELYQTIRTESTMKVVMLESCDIADYRGRFVRKKAVREGTEVDVPRSYGQMLIEQGLAALPRTKLPEKPKGLNITLAALIAADYNRINLDTLAKATEGKITLDKVRNYLQM